MRPTKGTQCDRILTLLEQRGKKGLTQNEAYKIAGVSRLGARIWDLRHLYTIPIKEEMVEVKTRYGKTHVARYTLEVQP